MKRYDDFVRYLESKQSVDDRALHRGVWEAMRQFVTSLPNAPRIVEIGSGHGAMIERLASQGLLQRATYAAVDPDEASMRVARRRFQFDARIGELELHTADLYDFASPPIGTWDLVIAHAVLDLFDLGRALPALASLCVPGGGFHFTINFDGDTIFEPAIDPVFDAEIVARYHQTMDERVVDGERAGHSQTGRRLFTALLAQGAVIEAAGSSDWVVWPRGGAYRRDEAYFLHFIVATVGRALAGSSDLDAARLDDWVARRHAQIEQGTLIYLAHQLDFFGRWPKGPTPHRPAPS